MFPRIPAGLQHRTLTSRQARISGVVLIILGLFVIGLTAALVAFSLDLIPLSIIFPGAYRDPDAEPVSVPIAAWALLLFIAIFGVVSLVEGVWQVLYGERNKYLVKVIIALALVFAAGGIIAEGLS